MDKGAHFHKSDFQVHTPRDARWEGNAAVTPAERKEYAAELVQACREKSIEAIAVTDHHDFAFFPYIRSAAAEEIDPIGNAIPEHKRLTVFPGVELTLSSPPCQALLILDADFDVDRLDDVLTALTIDLVEASTSKLASVDSVSPAAVTGLNDLEDKLNQHKWLKGRFILLPNVTDGGYKSLFREGFEKHYKEMRCVGGYVDGDYEARTSVGKKNILEGRQQNNGYPPKAVFQTSDNRKRNHSHLGAHISYVKWSEPTAEALRQACLAKESRLSLKEPPLPNVYVASLTVSNSKFLGHLDLDFNRQYNAIIGGRGTGKSTILEYLRWGLCDQPVESEDTDIVQSKRRTLIDNTLQKFDGEVIVEFFLNDVRHIVKRNSKKSEILLKIGDRDFVPATEQQVRALLPVQAYSQKQLSSVGVRIEELKRFVELPIRQDLDGIDAKLRDIAARIRVAYASLVRKRALQVEIDKHTVELSSLNKQLTGLRKALKGLSKEDEKTINDKSAYDEEEAIIEDINNQLDSAKTHIGDLNDAFEAELGENESDVELANTAVIASIRKLATSKLVEVKKGIEALADLFEPASMKLLNAEMAKWTKLRDAFDVKYEAAKGRAKVNQQQLDQIRAVEKRIAALRKAVADAKAAVAGLGAPEEAYKTLRATWDDLHQQKYDALSAQCGAFTSLSAGLIRAELQGGLHSAGLMARLKIAFSGMNIREDKIEKICASVAAAKDPFAEWNGVLAELEKLATHVSTEDDALPDAPRLNRCSLIENERRRIATGFDAARLVELLVTELEFAPNFLYCTSKKKAEYIAFRDASAGQQATALLTVLLNQPGAPLVIDQPEDDIDSKLVKDIVSLLWEAKKRRQLIFASHSANFVVNGDAELVVCCDYQKAGDQTHGVIKAAGAIDNQLIKDEITLVTEGGKEAFKLRMDKYGF